MFMFEPSAAIGRHRDASANIRRNMLMSGWVALFVRKISTRRANEKRYIAEPLLVRQRRHNEVVTYCVTEHREVTAELVLIPLWPCFCQYSAWFCHDDGGG